MISREAIDSFFASHVERGGALDRDMLWSFFFSDHDRAKLLRACPALEKLGYHSVGILEPGSRSDDQALLFLQGERVETHSAGSLHRRCTELDVFARQHRLETFDGFDVGNVDGSALFPRR